MSNMKLEATVSQVPPKRHYITVFFQPQVPFRIKNIEVENKKWDIECVSIANNILMAFSKQEMVCMPDQRITIKLIRTAESEEEENVFVIVKGDEL